MMVPRGGWGMGWEVSFVVKPISPVVLPAATKGFMSEN